MILHNKQEKIDKDYIIKEKRSNSAQALSR